MKFTIAIPSYNQASFLSQCLRSVIAQRLSGVHVEIFVYDGGSTDGSVDVIKRHSDFIDFWQSKSDGGQAQALRSAFKRATGDTFAWVNSDDLLAPEALSRVERFLDQQPDCALLYGDAVWIDHAGSPISVRREIDFDYGAFAFGYCYLPQPSTFFRRTAYMDSGGIDPSLDCVFDYDLWHRLIPMGVCHIPEVLSAIRNHEGTKTNTRRQDFEREGNLLRARYLDCNSSVFRLLHVYHRVRRVLKRALLGHYTQSRYGNVNLSWLQEQ